MDIIDAAHSMGIEYPGGIKALAIRMGMAPAVLTQKLNPNCSTHHLMILEALKMQVVCNRVDITRAMALELGYCLMPLPDLDIAEGNVNAAMAETCKEFGDFISKASEVIADGKMTPNERKETEKELRELVAAAGKLLKIMGGK